MTNSISAKNLQTMCDVKPKLWLHISDPGSAISDKNCETRTPSPLIQCWLQVCLLISDLGCLAWLLLAWHNIESGGRGDSG